MNTAELSHRSPSPLVFCLLVALLGLAAAPVQGGDGVWTPVGPGRNDIFGLGAVVPDAAAPGSVWAGVARGGLYRSDDHGVTWQWAGRPFAGGAVSVAAADPESPGALWVATSAGLYHTADAGAHWTLVSGPSYTELVAGPAALHVVPGRPATLYARTSHRILVSDDDGRNWRVALAQDGAIQADALALGARPAYYIVTSAGDGSGLFSTTDGGKTWTALSSCPALATGIDKIAASADALYVLPREEETLGLLRSRDGGATWRPVFRRERPAENFRLLDVKVDPASPRRVWVIGSSYGSGADRFSLWVSRNGGDTWRRRGQPPVGGALIFGPDAIYAMNEDSLAVSVDDGWTWRLVLRTPIAAQPPSRVSFDPGDPSHVMLIVGQRIYESADGGQAWSFMDSPEVNDVWSDPARPGHMFATGFRWGAVTNDGGRSWKTDYDGGFELIESPGGRTLFAGTCGVWRSRNGGESWREVLPCAGRPRVALACEESGNVAGNSCDSEPGRYLQKLEVDPAHPQVVYALTFWYGDYYPDHDPWWGDSELWRSRDGGSSWRRIATNVNAFALDRNRSRLYASRGRDLLYSDDGGNVWRKRSEMPLSGTAPGLMDLAVPTGMPFTIYGVASGLLRSQDGGRTWEGFGGVINTGGPCLLTVHPTDGRTVYLRSSSGVFRIRLPDGPPAGQP